MIHAIALLAAYSQGMIFGPPIPSEWFYLRADQRPTQAQLGKIDFDAVLAFNQKYLEFALGQTIGDEERKLMALKPDQAFSGATTSDTFNFEYKGGKLTYSRSTGRFRGAALDVPTATKGRAISRAVVEQRSKAFFAFFDTDPNPHVLIHGPSKGSYFAEARHAFRNVPIAGGAQCRFDSKTGRIIQSSFGKSERINPTDKIRLSQVDAFEVASLALSRKYGDAWIRIRPQNTRLEYRIFRSSGIWEQTPEENVREIAEVATPSYNLHANQIRWIDDRERIFLSYYVVVDARNGRVTQIGEAETSDHKTGFYPPEASGLWSDEPLRILKDKGWRTVLKGRLAKLDPRTETPMSGKPVTIANRLYICRLWFDEASGLVWDRTSDRRWVARANAELVRVLKQEEGDPSREVNYPAGKQGQRIKTGSIRGLHRVF